MATVVISSALLHDSKTKGPVPIGSRAKRAPFSSTAFFDTIPAGRLGSADEVGSLVAFLASDEASYLTGNLIQVDGGMTTGI